MAIGPLTLLKIYFLSYSLQNYANLQSILVFVTQINILMQVPLVPGRQRKKNSEVTAEVNQQLAGQNLTTSFVQTLTPALLKVGACVQQLTCGAFSKCSCEYVNHSHALALQFQSMIPHIETTYLNKRLLGEPAPEMTETRHQHFCPIKTG